MSANQPGKFIISLDFELMWGMFDKVSLAEYGDAIVNVHQVVPRLLQLFSEQQIHATWATVGMLLYENKAALEAARPQAAPPYHRPELSSYEHLKRAPIAATDPHYFAPALVRLIQETPHQELASHTFSHYYCLESKGGTETEYFAADCSAMEAAAATHGAAMHSIVFPRNQWHQAALEELDHRGYRAYRGTEDHLLYHARTDEKQNQPLIRALRLLDAYINISGHHTFTITQQAGLTNVPASRFLRPYNPRLALLEPLRLRRITSTMTQAAKYGECFHLWWHPHNFGRHTEENFRCITSIIEHFHSLASRYGMQSATMYEAATQTVGSTASTTSATTNRPLPARD